MINTRSSDCFWIGGRRFADRENVLPFTFAVLEVPSRSRDSRNLNKRFEAVLWEGFLIL
jgi:hypothetical protein